MKSMYRRKFINRLSRAASLPFLMPGVPENHMDSKSPKKIIKPKKLELGDTIGLVTPATFLTEDELRHAEEKMQRLGFRAYYSSNMLVRKGHLGGTDEQRAADLNYMFENDDIDGIWCGRGGYGSARILPYLNYDAIQNNPKPFIGYSDITSLHYGIHARTGLVTFHGPVAKEELNSFSERYLREVLIEGKQRVLYKNEEEEMQPRPVDIVEEGIQEPEVNRHVPETIVPGVAEGLLVGGNLSLVTAIAGTSFDIDMRGKIVFLEDVGEIPPRIDRMITQLLLVKDKLPAAAGVVLGVFADCEPKDPQKSLSLREVLYDRLSSLGVPVLYGLSFGHIKRNMMIPFGIEARLDASEQTLTLLEKAVS